MGTKRHIFQNGFTLVELIVVMAILAILGTLGFISIQGYSGSARESARLSNLNILERGLEVHAAATGTYPIPEDYILLSASGNTIGYQWYAKGIVLESIRTSGQLRDPSDQSYFTYSTNANRTRMQILGFMEKPDTLTVIPAINTAYAGGYSNRYAVSKGSNLGILLASGSLAPVQEQKSGSFTGVDVVNTSTQYIVAFRGKETISGTGLVLFTNIYNRNEGLINEKELSIYDPNLVGYWDMEVLFAWVGGNYFKDSSRYWVHLSCINSTSSWVLINCDNLQVSWKRGKGIGLKNKWSWSVEAFSNWNYAYQQSLKSITISAWIRVDSFTGHGIFRLDDQTPDIGNRLRLHITDNKEVYANIFLENWATADPWIVSTPLELGKWAHIAATFDQSSRKLSLYLNGVKQGASTHTNTTDYIWGYVLENTVWDGASEANYDEIRIYDRALSDTEIQTLYSAVR